MEPVGWFGPTGPARSGRADDRLRETHHLQPCYARAVTNYRRNFICGGSFFFTANLAERRLRLLVDLTSQLIKWAGLIHWLAVRYAGVRSWLFSWLPFHIPPEWHNYIVLLMIFLSVANVGFYKQTGKFYFFQALITPVVLLFGGLPVDESDLKRKSGIDGLALQITEFCSLMLSQAVLLSAGAWVAHFFGYTASPIFWEVMKWGSLCALIGASGILVAWRWLIGTAFLFGMLVGINEIYVRWLESVVS